MERYTSWQPSEFPSTAEKKSVRKHKEDDSCGAAMHTIHTAAFGGTREGEESTRPSNQFLTMLELRLQIAVPERQEERKRRFHTSGDQMGLLLT